MSPRTYTMSVNYSVWGYLISPITGDNLLLSLPASTGVNAKKVKYTINRMFIEFDDDLIWVTIGPFFFLVPPSGGFTAFKWKYIGYFTKQNFWSLLFAVKDEIV